MIKRLINKKLSTNTILIDIIFAEIYDTSTIYVSNTSNNINNPIKKSVEKAKQKLEKNLYFFILKNKTLFLSINRF